MTAHSTPPGSRTGRGAGRRGRGGREVSPCAALTAWVACGQDREEVADDAEVDELEDRRLLVLVDGDDRLGGLHAGPVLDRAGDAGRDVELGRDLLAGLADLVAVGVPAGVDRGAGGADGGAEGVGERLDRREVAAPCRGRRRRRSRPRSAPGRPVAARGWRSVIRAAWRRSETLTSTASLGGRAGGRLGRGRVGLDHDDRRALGDGGRDGVAAGEDRLGGCTPSGPAWTSTASVIRPEAVLIGSRAAISLPSAEDEISTAAGEAGATSWASTSALGATR